MIQPELFATKRKRKVRVEDPADLEVVAYNFSCGHPGVPVYRWIARIFSAHVRCPQCRPQPMPGIKREKPGIYKYDVDIPAR